MIKQPKLMSAATADMQLIRIKYLLNSIRVQQYACAKVCGEIITRYD